MIEFVLVSIRVMASGTNSKSYYNCIPSGERHPSCESYLEMLRLSSASNMIGYVRPLLSANPAIKNVFFTVDNSGSMTFRDIEESFLSTPDLLSPLFPIPL
jgi:hypothetical protein